MFGGKDCIPRASAEQEKHEWTSWSAVEEIFKDMEKAGNEIVDETISNAEWPNLDSFSTKEEVVNEVLSVGLDSMTEVGLLL